MFIRRDHINMLQNRIGKRDSWGRVEHHDGVFARKFHGTLHNIETNFQLQQQHRCIGNDRRSGVDVTDRQRMIRTRYHDDEVLRIVRNSDECATGRFGHRRQVRDVDMIPNERRTKRFTSGIIPHCANECRTSAGSRCGNGLIGTLPATGLEVSMGRDGLTRVWQALGECDEIEVG